MSVFADLEIYRTVLEHMQTGIYMVDCDQKIHFWNDGAEIITGHLRQDVVGHYCRDFFPPQKEAGKNGVCELGGALASVLRDGRPAIAEVTLRHKAGHQVTVRVRAVPIRNRAGGVIGAAESMDADRSPSLNSDGRDIVAVLAQELGKLPNKRAMEGHSDAKAYSAGRNYSNWELSADRANSARRLMQLNGIGENQVTQVRGFADQRLRKLDAPLDPSRTAAFL